MSAIGWIKKWWPLESGKTFTTVEDQNVMCTGNKDASHRVKLKKNCVFCFHKDTILAVTRHMLTIGRRLGRKFRESKDCNRKEKPSRRHLVLRSICNSVPVIGNKHTGTKHTVDSQMANKLNTPCHEHSLCVRRRRRRPSSQRAGHSPTT
jgi:hypothetical protein